MSLQRRLVQAMLALLALAAFAGVSTIFLPGSGFVGRVATTLVAAAIAIAMAIPVSRSLDRQETRSSGLFGLAAIVVGFCMALMAIWARILHWTNTERLVLTTLAYVTCAVPAAIFFALRRRDVGRTAGAFGIVVAAVTFMLWLATIWAGWFGLSEDQLAPTAGIVGGAGVLIAACLVGRRGDGHGWRWLGVVAGAAAMAMGLYGIWIDSSGDARWLVQALITAGAVAALNLLLRTPFRGTPRWLVLLTALALAGSAASASAANLATHGFDYGGDGSLSVRLLSAGVIVTVCGLLALVVIHAFNRRVLVTRSARIDEIRFVDLSCPRCAKRRQAPIGESRCPGCGLIFLLRVAEPRCAKCDYPLLDTPGRVCPECGEPVETPRLGGAEAAPPRSR